MSSPCNISPAVKYPLSSLGCSTWFERDRQHVHLFSGDENTTVLELWDEQITEAVQDGFLDMRRVKASMIDMAGNAGLIDFAL